MRVHLKFFLMFIIFTSCSLVADTQLKLFDSDNLKIISHFPVLHKGRNKPFDSWARETLLTFSAKSTVSQYSASHWLALLLIDSKTVLAEPVFQVNHPEVILALQLEPNDKRRYSYNFFHASFQILQKLISHAVKIPSKEQSIVEREVLKLNHNLNEFFNYQQFSLKLHNATKSEAHHHFTFPAAFNVSNEKNHALSEIFIELKQNYSNKNYDNFKNSLLSMTKVLGKNIDQNQMDKCAFEVIVNEFDPLYKAEILYGFSLLALIFSSFASRRKFYFLSIALLLLGLLSHSFAIAARMWIMSRPPVTNLYSTFIFVGWACVVLGLIIAYTKDYMIGLISGGVSGLLFLLIAGKYSIEGDTMGVMVAVLNSNFWLATHVITISLGYAGCCLAGILAHIYLVRVISKKTTKEVLGQTYNIMLATLGFGLALTFIGTVLGGVWADQSWGRFWGWDPKENGALLIVLWCALIMHARLAGMISKVGMVIGTLLGIQVVFLAWFGVNLLGVGLHSYGFTTGVAHNLLIFFCVELLFVVITRFMSHKNSGVVSH